MRFGVTASAPGLPVRYQVVEERVLYQGLRSIDIAARASVTFLEVSVVYTRGPRYETIPALVVSPRSTGRSAATGDQTCDGWNPSRASQLSCVRAWLVPDHQHGVRYRDG